MLDKLLLDAAIAAGAEFHERFSVRNLLFEDGGVRGIRGRGARRQRERDRPRGHRGGRPSFAGARCVKATPYNERPVIDCGYYSYWEGFELDGMEFRELERRGVGIFPTNDGLACICVGQPFGNFPEFRADVEGHYHRTQYSASNVADRAREATRVEPICGTAELRNGYRAYGPGWALVRDAGYIKDPVTGHGISDAFHVPNVSRPHSTMPGPHASHSTRRSATTSERETLRQPMYDFTCNLASFAAPTTMMVRLIAALQGNQADTNRFLGIVPGTTPRAFFSPANVRGILRQAEAPPATAIGPEGGAT